MENELLINEMKVALATSFSLYLKAHSFHWNVTGPSFAYMHTFFADVYVAIHGSIDLYAEHIRALGVKTPGCMTRFIELSKLADAELIPSDALGMIQKLDADNEILLDQLRVVRNIAEKAGQYGVVNFIEGQIDYHDKLSWMLKSHY